MRQAKLFNSVLILLLFTGIIGTSSCSPVTVVGYSSGVSALIQAMPDWQQANLDGFGNLQIVEVTALEAFSGYLYAGTYNTIDPAQLFDGAQIFRSKDGVTWTAVTQPGFGNSHDIAPPAILDFIVFNNQLYASTGRGNASQIWRSLNGVTWAPMDVTGFGDPDNMDVTALAAYGGMIYAGVRNQVTGAQIWSSFTGDNNSWTRVAPAVPGTSPASVTGFAVSGFDGGLYAAVESEEGPAQIWRSYGGDWEVTVNNGFGDVNTLFTGGMAEFGGNLYVGAGNTATGAQLWRTSDGATWQQIINPGFGDPNNKKIETVFVFQNQLYVGAENMVTGLEVWRSADGNLWEQVNVDGFGDSQNTTTNGSHATSEFLSQLYVGTSNITTGAELWRTLQQGTSTFSLTVVKSGTGSGTVISNPAGINCGQDCSEIYAADASITLTASAASGSTFGGWSGGGCSGTGTCTVTMTVARTITAVFNASSQTFVDVPSSHPYYQDIETLYASGLTGGCSTSPLKFCPDQIMDRAQAAVFMVRGSLGAGFVPDPAQHILMDTWTAGPWAEPWAEAIINKGLSAGCSVTPKKYCPWVKLSREQVAVFGLRMKYGVSYLPPAAVGTVFADMTDPNHWGTGWAEQAYRDGLLPACGTSAGRPLFCPTQLVTRGQGAYVIVRAKGLPMP